MFKSVGLAIEDVAIGGKLLELAEQAEVGQQLPIDGYALVARLAFQLPEVEPHQGLMLSVARFANCHLAGVLLYFKDSTPSSV